MVCSSHSWKPSPGRASSLPKVTQLGSGRAQIQTTTAQLWATPGHHFPTSDQASGISPGRRQSWGACIQQLRPQCTQGHAGQKDQPPNATFPPWKAGGHSGWTQGHRTGCEASSPGCRQGRQCLPLGGLSLLVEPGQGKARRAQEENFQPCLFLSLSQSKRRRLCTPPTIPRNTRAWGRHSHPAPPGRRRLPPDDGWRPLGGGHPGNRTVPKATGRPTWGPPSISRPQPCAGGVEASGRGLQGLPRKGRRQS